MFESRWVTGLSALALVALTSACGGGSDNGGAGGAGGASGGSSGAGASGGSSASGGTSSGGSGGAAGSAGSGGSVASGGSSGSVLFHDDFDAANPAWHFDQADPGASYVYEGGGLRVSGASLQAFGYIDADPSWGDDYEVEIVFRIETGLVGGAVVRADPQVWNALNCNLRNDYEQLRVAKHDARSYLTLGSTDTPVDPGVDYKLRAVAQGDSLHCYEEGGPDVVSTAVPYLKGTVGFYVYQGTVRFESFEVRTIPPS